MIRIIKREERDKYGTMLEYSDGHKNWFIYNTHIDHKAKIEDPEFKQKYPEMFNEIIIYLVYNS